MSKAHKEILEEFVNFSSEYMKSTSSSGLTYTEDDLFIRMGDTPVLMGISLTRAGGAVKSYNRPKLPPTPGVVHVTGIDAEQ